jgi:hypothetical protein
MLQSRPFHSVYFVIMGLLLTLVFLGLYTTLRASAQEAFHFDDVLLENIFKGLDAGSNNQDVCSVGSDGQNGQSVAGVVNGQTSIKAPVIRKAVFLGGGIGRPGAILAETRIVSGKRICLRQNDHPTRSNINPLGHVDAECCLDRDETPNSLCYYPPATYGDLVRKYLKSRN